MVGPIVQLEALQLARRKHYYVLRVVYALLLGILLWFSYESATYKYRVASLNQVASVAGEFFWQITWMQLTVVLLIVPPMLSGVIAGLHDRKTLDELLSTPLSSLEILLGKSLVRAAQIVLLLATAAPILALSGLMGGIDYLDVLKVTFVTLAVLWHLTGFTVWNSVESPDTRTALIRTYLSLIGYLLYPALLFLLREYLTSGISPLFTRMDLDWIEDLIKLGYPYSLIYESDWSLIGWGVILQGIAGGLWLALAVARLRQAVQHRGSTRAKRPSRRFGWVPQLRDDPMKWKELLAARSLRLGKLASIVAILLWLLGVGVMVAYSLTKATAPGLYDLDFISAFYGYLGVFFVSIHLLFLGARGATLISSEKEGDRWMTLLSVPLEPEEIVWGKVVGNLYAGRWTASLAVIAWIFAGLVNPWNILRWPLLFGALYFFSVVVTMIGLHFSIRARNSTRGMVATMITLFFFGGGYLFCCFPLWAFAVTGPDPGMLLIAVQLSACIPVQFASIVTPWREITLDMMVFLITNIVTGIILYGFVLFALWKNLTFQFPMYTGRMEDMSPGSPLPVAGESTPEIERPASEGPDRS